MILYLKVKYKILCSDFVFRFLCSDFVFRFCVQILCWFFVLDFVLVFCVQIFVLVFCVGERFRKCAGTPKYITTYWLVDFVWFVSLWNKYSLKRSERLKIAWLNEN